MSRKTSKTITAKNTKQTTLRGYFLDTATTVKSLDTPRVSINREDIPLQNSVLTTTDTSVDKGTTTTTAGRGISYNNQELSYRVFGQDKRQVINQKSLNLCDPSVPTAPVYSSQEIVQTSPSLPLLSPLRTAPKNRAAYPRQQFNPGERTLPSILIEDPWNTSGKRSNSSYTHFENNYPFQAKAKTFSLKNYRHQPKRQKSRGPSNEYAPPLSNEQQAILNMIVDQKESVFFTGSAGTGKSVLLRALITKLREIHNEGVAVTASTGIAACNINGCTLHSFGGIGLGTDEVSVLSRKIAMRSKVVDRWKSTKVLIIDEISMVDAALFDKLENLARLVRGINTPFGGIQVIVTGDFFQLPPVSKSSATKFAFEAVSWSSVIQRTALLKSVFRQKDPSFVTILNEMRLGTLSENSIKIFNSLEREPVNTTNIVPTELFPLRSQVERSNSLRLEALQGECHTYRAKDSGDANKLAACISPSIILLKRGAQVMLLKNMDSTLVNGSLGIVVGFTGEAPYNTTYALLKCLAPNRTMNDDFSADTLLSMECPVVEFADNRQIIIEEDSWNFETQNGDLVASRTQYPLMLAWAMSIHKSQGQTIDRVKVDLGQAFERGQAYVALSRATCLETLQVLNFSPSKVMVHPRVTEFYKSLETLQH